ncbi:Adenylyl cyclase-associated protein [Intoshia linei]|uniref:Adenylyl cyclase-associated protein n=1 Tax=Intoshia linei TaxID=1819745 RepID=A0A177AXS0_9BILA|nr:Adenylyl cyclase-associated protein [Intoshia linei]
MNSLSEFDTLIEEDFNAFVKISQTLDPKIIEQVNIVSKVVNEIRKVISLAEKIKKPTEIQFAEILKPLAQQIGDTQAFRNDNRKNVSENYFAAISESIPAFAWVQVTPTPGPHINGMCDAAQYYTNRILVDSKKKNDTDSIIWTQLWIDFLKNMALYVKKIHTTGLVWNPKGTVYDGTQVTEDAAPKTTTTTTTGGGLTSLFNDLNSGLNITKGLKHVKKGDKIIPTLKTSGSKVTTTATKAQIKKPIKQYAGKKWTIENFVKDTVEVDIKDKSETCMLISNTETVIKIKNKHNYTLIENCNKCHVHVDTIISTLDIVKCKRAHFHITNRVGSVNISSSDEIHLHVYDSTEEFPVLISTSCNVIIVKVHADNTETEYPLSTQVLHTWNKNTIKSGIVPVE